MNDPEILKIIITTVLGSVLGSGAVLGFVQFLIQRKDKQRENTIDKKLEEIVEEFKKGLDERENTGKKRFDTHAAAIDRLNEQNQERYDELKSALIKLAETVQEREKYEKYIGASLMAISHDKLIYLGKKYQKRGAITLAEKANLKYFYTPYKEGLGGNGDAQEIYLYCMTLPVVSDIEAQNMDNEIRKTDLSEILPNS